MDKFIFKNLIIPVFHNYKKQTRLKYYNLLKIRNSYSREELLELQWKKLKILINHCYKNIPYYMELFKEIELHPDDIKDYEDYEKIPLLKKQNIRDDYKKLINPKLSDKEICCCTTGGSTGIPVKIYKSIEDREYGFAVRYRSNAWCGWEYGDKSAWIVSDVRRLDELKSIKGKMSSFVDRKLVLDTRNTNKESMAMWAKQIKKFKPECIYAYATILTKFSKFLIDNKIQISGVKGVFSTAELLRERELISNAFSAPVYDQYGASEIPCIAHECPFGNMHVNIDEVLVEYLDIEKGSKIKKIVCTPLYVYGMPLLRYELGDCVIPVERECDCNLPFPAIKIKASRISDNLLSPNGILVPTINFGMHVANMAKDIKQIQLIQENLTEYSIKIVSEEEVRAENEKIVSEIIHKMLNSNTNEIKIKFEYRQNIPNCESGKFRPVISKVIEQQKLSLS